MGQWREKWLTMNMHIRVAPCDWGDAQLSNIQALLTDAASHITRHLREPFQGTTVVVATQSSIDGPMTHYRPSLQGPFTIRLSARNHYWSQFVYQFSHELCHVLSDFERLREGPNGWFHEAVCELASVFTIRRMAEQWPSRPPYPNWADYANSLDSYAEECLTRKECQLPAGTTLTTWLLAEEGGLRRDRYQRDENAVVAYSLLPIFESEPAGWNAIRHLPDSTAMLGNYLIEWHEMVESVDRPFVERIMDAFQ